MIETVSYWATNFRLQGLMQSKAKFRLIKYDKICAPSDTYISFYYYSAVGFYLILSIFIDFI